MKIVHFNSCGVYIVPFGELFIVQMTWKWYHIKAENPGYNSYETCVELSSIVFMLERGIDGRRAMYLSGVVIWTRLDHVLAHASWPRSTSFSAGSPWLRGLYIEVIPRFSHRERGQRLYLAPCEESMLFCWVISKLSPCKCSGAFLNPGLLNDAIYENISL